MVEMMTTISSAFFFNIEGMEKIKQNVRSMSSFMRCRSESTPLSTGSDLKLYEEVFAAAFVVLMVLAVLVKCDWTSFASLINHVHHDTQLDVVLFVTSLLPRRHPAPTSPFQLEHYAHELSAGKLEHKKVKNKNLRETIEMDRKREEKRILDEELWKAFRSGWHPERRRCSQWLRQTALSARSARSYRSYGVHRQHGKSWKTKALLYALLGLPKLGCSKWRYVVTNRDTTPSKTGSDACFMMRLTKPVFCLWINHNKWERLRRPNYF